MVRMKGTPDSSLLYSLSPLLIVVLSVSIFISLIKSLLSSLPHPPTISTIIISYNPYYPPSHTLPLSPLYLPPSLPITPLILPPTPSHHLPLSLPYFFSTTPFILPPTTYHYLYHPYFLPSIPNYPDSLYHYNNNIISQSPYLVIASHQTILT